MVAEEVVDRVVMRAVGVTVAILLVAVVAVEATVVEQLLAAAMPVAVATPLISTGTSLASRSSHWVHQAWQKVFWVRWLWGGSLAIRNRKPEVALHLRTCDREDWR